jgi:hypothetical protein
VIPWLDDGTSEEGSDEDEDEEVVDETALYGDSIIDVGVTSGSDPSDWNPIDVEPGDRGRSGQRPPGNGT